MIASRCNIIEFNKTKQNIFSIFRRLKSFKTSKEKKNDPSTKALNHFDDFYKAVFLNKWPSIRLGLLSRQKQVAVINNFGDVKETEELLQNEGALDFRSFLNILKEKSQKVEKGGNAKDKTNLEEIILRQRQEEEEKALNELIPKDKEFRLRTENNEVQSGNKKEENLGSYDPEDPKTSLMSDLSTAQIDTTRLILPESKTQEAILQDFMPVTQLRGLEGFIPEADYYKYYQSNSEILIKIEDELDLDFSVNLKVYTFDRGDMTEFPEPTRCAHGVYNYLRVDGGDILTALALDVQKKDKVLDFCSHSGNIAFCIFQMLPQVLVCIDSNKKKTEEIFKEYLFDYSPSWNDLLLITSKNFNYEKDNLVFDKILVNVPCTEDKISVFEREGKENMFHPSLIKKRLELPQLQSSLLVEALKLVKPGGTVVYSTTTLSPVQNDGVVNEALLTVWKETKMECTVKNLSPALAYMSEFFRFADFLPMKFGTLILPFLPTNFGPRYFCKIIKNEQNEH